MRECECLSYSATAHDDGGGGIVIDVLTLDVYHCVLCIPDMCVCALNACRTHILHHHILYYIIECVNTVRTAHTHTDKQQKRPSLLFMNCGARRPPPVCVLLGVARIFIAHACTHFGTERIMRVFFYRFVCVYIYIYL